MSTHCPSAATEVIRLIRTVSEREAAGLFGWTPASFRSHRRLQQAEQDALVVTGETREALRSWGAAPVGPPLPACHADLLEHAWAVLTADGRVRLTRQGLNVGRCLRGTSGLGLPNPVEGKGPRRYDPQAIRAWLDQHPQHRDRDQLVSESLTRSECADVMEIEPRTLSSFLSKAKAAQARIDAGEAKKDDHSVADRCPRSVIVGFEVRHLLVEVEEWLLRKGRVARGSNAC